MIDELQIFQSQRKNNGDLMMRGIYILVAALLSLNFLKVHAQGQFDVGNVLKTPTATIITRRGTKSECMRLQNFDTCQLLEINGKPTISEYYVSMQAAIPNVNDIKVIFVTGSTGGNACCEYHYLVDLTEGQPQSVEVESPPKPNDEKPIIKLLNDGFIYENYGEGKGLWGEQLWKVYRYKYGTGRVEILNSSPKYSFTQLDKKKYPEEILNDPVNREPIINLLGRDEFLRLRDRIELQFELKRYSNGIYMGAGCKAHSCGSDEAMFILDSQKKQAWAIYVYQESGRSLGKIYGSLSGNDYLPRSIIENWIKERNLNWGDFLIANQITEDKPISGALPPLVIKKNN